MMLTLARSLAYRGHMVRASAISGRPQVAVFLQDKRLAVLETPSLEDGIAVGKDWVDAQFAESARQRRAPNIATVAEYSNYLAAHPLKEHQIKMLRALATGARSSSEIAAAAGWPSYSSANNHFGSLGRDVGREIGLTFIRYGNDEEFFTSALAQEHAEPDAQAGSWTFELHPELIEALKQHGIV